MPANRNIVVIGGPNGAGKSTIARNVLVDTLGVHEFVNADVIATGLSGFDPERAAFAAGRVMLARLHELARGDTPFAFESTLASRSFAPWLADLSRREWRVHLIYVWLQSPDLAVQRVAARVRRGGHSIPENIIRRRYARSARNFWNLYRPLASSWRMFENSSASPILIAMEPRSRLDPSPIAPLLARFIEIANAQPETH